MAGSNRALAVAKAGQVLATIPVPPGATASASAPVRGLRHLGVYDGPVDPSLTRTSWWVVPMSYRQLVTWYGAHSPANLGSTYEGDSKSPAPSADLYWETPARSTSYSTPAAVVSYARIGAHSTAIRTDATLAARYDRVADTLVPASVTSIDITVRNIAGPDPDRASTTATAPAQLTKIIGAFDNLRGAMAHTSPTPCGSPTGNTYAYTVRFQWPGHVLSVDPGAPLCGIGMGLKLDGVKLSQSLEDGKALDAALQAALND